MECDNMFGKKGFALSDMSGIVITMVVVVIVLGLGLTILEGIMDNQTPAGNAYNATSAGVSALATFTDYLPTIAIVIVAALVLGILITYLARGTGGA